jgi:GH43 family beta-xylosidase
MPNSLRSHHRHSAFSRRFAGCSLAFAWCMLLAACQVPTSPAPASNSFYNPLNTLNGADPWLQFYEGNYYLTATQWGDIRMWKSPTLAGLATAAPETIWSDPTSSRCCNVWAPEFHLLDGPNGKRWYLYYSAGTDGTLDNQRMHVLESEGADPLGPYSYKARIFDPSNDGWAIDHSPLLLDGKLYLLFSSWLGPDQTLFIAPMSDPWTISGSRVELSRPTHDWERQTGNVNEGPEVLQHDGKTFVVYSASACWGPDYKLGMLTYGGGDPLSAGAWTKHPEPVFARSDANEVYAPGHNGFFTSPDGKESWIVYHANASPSDGCTGERTTRVQKFTWNADGTPNFGEPLALSTPIAPPSGESGVAPERDTIPYALVSKSGETCLDLAEDSRSLQQQPCTEAAGQIWSLDYLGNGAYRLLRRSSGVALSAAEGEAAVQLAPWAYAPGQQWRLLTAAEGWLRIENVASGQVLGCAADGALQLGVYAPENDCQHFRLQPLRALKIVNMNSNKPLAVEAGSLDDGASIVLQANSDAPGQRWVLQPRDGGFFQIVADHSDKCIGAGASSQLAQQPCGDDQGQQWRLELLNDGMVRLVARQGGLVFDVVNCRGSDGSPVQLWSWLDNMCQRFYLAP